MYTPEPTIDDVVEALTPLRDIKKPYADIEGDPINSADVFELLPPESQELVRVAEVVTKAFVRQLGDEEDEPNEDALAELEEAGFPAYLGPDQYDPYRLAGTVTISEEWKLDIGDREVPSNS